jgi:N-acetylglucosamine-6-phosphate deacetylase
MQGNVRATRFYNATLVTGTGVFRNAAFVVANGRFTEITGAAAAVGADDSGRDDRASGDSLAGCDLGGRIVVPGFIDTHIHGVKGCDFENPDCDFAAGARLLKMTGTTSFLATISPFTPSGARKPPYRTLACEGLEGFQLEGPYVNPSKQGGFYGGQIRPYDEAEADDIIRSFRGAIRIVTAAPECVDLPSLVALSHRHGFALSAGHTDADYDTALEAFGAGFSRATHLFNAMRGFDHREPGVLEAALLDDRVHCELIADLRHLSPQALKLAFRLKPIGSLTAITDSVCPDAPGITVRGSVAYKGDTVYGSQSTMYELFRHLTGPLLALPLADAVRLTSVNAGQALDLDVGDIVPGMRANFIVMGSDYRIEAVYTASDFGPN